MNPTWDETVPTWDDTLPQEEALQDSTMGDVARGAINEAFLGPGSVSRQFATDPIAQAKALPALAGTVGALSPIPGGATLGTVGGRQLSNAALMAYGRRDQIPSIGSQVAEGALAAIGDVAAIPYVKNKIYGGRIGAAENAAGVVTRAPDRLPTAGNVGEYLNVLESQIDNGTLNTAQAARDAVAGMRYINGNPNIVGKSSDISVQAARVGAKAQDLLNRIVPGRAAPAKSLGRAMTIPNAISRKYKSIPPMVRRGAIPFAVASEFIRRMSER